MLINETNSLARPRPGEEKIGQNISFAKNQEHLIALLQDSFRKYVIFGIPEDIGVRANFGRRGAHTAFLPTMESFLNMQSNYFMSGEDIIIAGALFLEDLMKEAEHLNPKIPQDLKSLRELTAEIDNRVSNLMKLIVSAGKIPLVIGGGHNNAYGNIKGSSMALESPINVINCDPHSDFRSLEGRHSGNGFSYAFMEGFMNKYAVLGLHENYNNANALEAFRKNGEQLMHQSFESVFVREELSFNEALRNCISFVSNLPCGIELDLDGISNVPSSAKTSSGLTSIQARRYLHQAALSLNCVYLHIAEAAPVLAHRKADNKTGKLIAYLLSDFIKACNQK
jgi:formiminoglutamase